MVSITTHKNPIALHPVRSARQVAERLGHYFDQHPQISREDFLLAAIEKEIDSRTSKFAGTWRGNARPQGRGPSSFSNVYWPVSAGDIRIHVRLAQRLVNLNRRRHSWREKLRRVLFRNGLVSWVRSQVGLEATTQSMAKTLRENPSALCKVAMRFK